MDDKKKQFHANRFHWALRKCLDSQASSIAWNAINVTTEEQWGRFIDAVNKVEGATIGERCEDIFLYGESALNLLMIGLEMLTDGEWEVLEKYSWREQDD